MSHSWSLETDGNRATVRTLLFDYRKTFDLIDHSILVNKLRNLNVPRSIVNWIIDFLSNRVIASRPSPFWDTAGLPNWAMAFCIDDK